MLRILLVSITVFATLSLKAQYDMQLSNMDWKLDSEILLKMENDSTYSFDLRHLFHVTDVSEELFNTEFVYYPVNLGQDYINEVKNQRTDKDTSERAMTTLWSSLHETLGGGWVHFTNCLLYALETDALSLTAPLMKRPESDWKPSPMTESYKRTRKWAYYAPVSQKPAQKEYKTRQKNNNLGDVKNLPGSFTDAFLTTNTKTYQALVESENAHERAKIDLVKLLLGANFLGEAQISYISSSVLNSVSNYTVRKVPSVVIFDEYDAAVAMMLNTDGYKVKRIVFREGASISVNEADKRTKEIEQIIDRINGYNNQAFKKRLESYYHQ